MPSVRQSALCGITASWQFLFIFAIGYFLKWYYIPIDILIISKPLFFYQKRGIIQTAQ